LRGKGAHEYWRATDTTRHTAEQMAKKLGGTAADRRNHAQAGDDNTLQN
jgi:hypothetical protein